MSEIRCTVKEAIEKLSHMNENDEVILTINDLKKYEHAEPSRIKMETGKQLIKKAKGISYQDNDYFGRFSLYGITKEKSIVHNLLFPQLE